MDENRKTGRCAHSEWLRNELSIVFMVHHDWGWDGHNSVQGFPTPLCQNPMCPHFAVHLGPDVKEADLWQVADAHSSLALHGPLIGRLCPRQHPQEGALPTSIGTQQPQTLPLS